MVADCRQAAHEVGKWRRAEMPSSKFCSIKADAYAEIIIVAAALAASHQRNRQSSLQQNKHRLINRASGLRERVASA
jgi:hypothetical protein